MKKSYLFGLVALAILIALPFMLKNYGVFLISKWLVFVIATMGLNLTVGYAGQKSLGHAAFFGIGAYTVAILLKAGISFWIGLPLAAIGCFVIGLGLGFPALRVQTIYLAFATLGFNNSRGALLGGLIVGVSENLAAAYISPTYKDAVALVVFMLVILFKPQGLLGKKTERKV